MKMVTMYGNQKLNSQKRKACIITLKIILNSLIRWFAPILSFTTEEIYQLITNDDKSIHLKNFLNIPEDFKNEKLNSKWVELINLRNICNISIEEKRANKEIGSSLEANLEIKVNKKLIIISQNIDFAELCITSHAEILEHSEESVKVKTSKAKGNKCPVCWKIVQDKCSRHPHPDIK